MRSVEDTRSQAWFAAAAEGPYRMLDAERTNKLLFETMIGTGHPPQLSPLAPFLLRHDRYRQLFAATKRLMEILSKTLAALGKNPQEQMQALGIDPLYLPALLPTAEIEFRYAGCMVRPDILIGPAGPRFIELNVSAGFGGTTETHLLHQVFTNAYGTETKWLSTAPDPFEVRATFLDEVASEESLERSVLIVGDPADGGGDTSQRMFDLEVEALRRRGFRASFISPADLCELPAQNFDLGIRRFSVVDWVRNERDQLHFDALRAVIDDGCLMLPSQSSMMMTDKRLLALVSEGLACHTLADRAFVTSWIPWTRIVRDRHVFRHGQRHDLVKLILNKKDDFVLKRGVGHSGLEVATGCEVEEAEWRRTVAASMDGSSVVQEYVASQSSVLELNNEQGLPESAAVDSIVSPMVIGGRAAGCWARYIRAGTPRTNPDGIDLVWNETVVMPLS